MSKIFAKGTHSRAICDRCGFEIDYQDLHTEWTGFRVCKSCLDYKTKQEFPDTIFPDAEALRDPRPDNDIEAHLGTVKTSTSDIGDSFDQHTLTIELGTVTVVIS